MAEDQGDSAEKTEEPTAKRIQEAVKKGQVAVSKEISSFLVFVALALNIVWFAPVYAKNAVIYLSRFINRPEDLTIDETGVFTILRDVATEFGLFMMVPVGVLVFIAIFSSFIQNGFIFSGESIIPKLDKISPIKGVKRMFSLKSFMEFVKGVIKITVVGFVSYTVVRSDLHRVESLVAYSIADMLHIMSSLALKVVIAAASVMLVIAVLDFMYQKFEYIKSLRMTKQEIKEEFKQSEGDPQIKARLRQIRQDRLRKRMMAAVPEADVVIRNPDHYAVALKYDEINMKAPEVVAMGMDLIALKIIEVAEENDVPTVRNPPLARALYSSSKIDDEIPLEHYQAVAEVISYVYRLKGKYKQYAGRRTGT